MNSSETSRQLAAMLAALAQATRLRIVEVVAAQGSEGIAAGDIARAVHCPASTLSFHLKELSQAGLLAATPQGRFIRYRVQPGAFASLAQLVSALAAEPATTARPGRRAGRKRSSKDEPGGGGSDGQLSIFSE
jgi:DNA-binding transcriptional ArsR family regulator